MVCYSHKSHKTNVRCPNQEVVTQYPVYKTRHNLWNVLDCSKESKIEKFFQLFFLGWWLNHFHWIIVKTTIFCRLFQVWVAEDIGVKWSLSPHRFQFTTSTRRLVKRDCWLHGIVFIKQAFHLGNNHEDNESNIRSF